MCGLDNSVAELVNKYNELFINHFKSLIRNGYENQKMMTDICNDLVKKNIHENPIERGGLSGSSCYNKTTHQLDIAGWYLPVDAFDRIIIEADGQYVGEADIGVERLDVELNNKWYKNSKNSGFVLNRILPAIEKIDQITIRAIKSNVIVKESVYDIRNI